MVKEESWKDSVHQVHFGINEAFSLLITAEGMNEDFILIKFWGLWPQNLFILLTGKGGKLEELSIYQKPYFEKLKIFTGSIGLNGNSPKKYLMFLDSLVPSITKK